MFACDFEACEMNPRVLVAREADVAQLACLLALPPERRVGALCVEDAVRILEAKNLVMLH